MFLNRALSSNRLLLEAAVHLHRSGQIPPGCFVLDLDAIRANARLQAETARQHGLDLYFMTKQIARVPDAARAIVAAGISAAVAVDAQEAMELADQGVRVGHIGHLVQPPEHLLPGLLRLHPEHVTLFSSAKAAQVNAAAATVGVRQKVLLRVIGQGDMIYPGQEGGFPLSALDEAVGEITRFPHVELAGVTAFPCLLYHSQTRLVEPTPNLATLLTAAERLVAGGWVKRPVINAPSLTSVATIPLLARHGATQGEPGHSLTGTTPLHADSEQPEQLAMVYVSEISHVQGGRAYAFGGGYYRRGHVTGALVLRDSDAVGRTRPMPFMGLPADAIDYYLPLEIPSGQSARVGDTALFSFRAQAFTGRSYVALLEGVRHGTPRVVAVYDRRNVPVHAGTGFRQSSERGT